MNLDIIRTQTTWNDAAGSINSNYAKIADAIAQLKANGGGGGGTADTVTWADVFNKPAWIIQAGNSKPKYSYDELTDTPDLSELATKTWVESELSDYAKTETVEALSTKVGNKEDNTGIYKIISDVETALIEDIPTTVSQLTDSGDYLKKASAETTYAKIASIQGFENRIGGLEGAVPQLNERVTTVEGKVSSLNETVSTGENNLLDRVNTIETDYVTSGDLESAITELNISQYLPKTEASTTYATIASVSTLQTTLEAAITKKADSATTLSGYGITDAYTKIEVDKLLEDNATKTWVNVNYATVNSVTTIKNTLTGQIGAVNTNLSTLQTKVSNQAETILANEQGLEELRTTVGDLGDAIPTNNNQLTNGAGYITSAALALYLKTEDAKETYATKDFVNNKLVNYATIVSVTAIQNTLTGQIGAVGASVEQLAATKLDSSYFTLTNIKSTLGISDWALAVIKPSYAWSEITSRPTALSQFTDDVVAGNYLRSIQYSTEWDANAIFNAGIYSGQIANLPSGSPYGRILSLPYYFDKGSTTNNFVSQLFITNGDATTTPNEMYFRTSQRNSWNVWNRVITDKNIGNYNAGSATKLETPRTLWGQSFDGTNNISGAITLGGDLNNVAGGIYIHKTNEINSFNGKLYLNHRGNGLSGYGSTNDIVMVCHGGKVGIGLLNPEERLHVNGTIKSGNLSVSNQIDVQTIVGKGFGLYSSDTNPHLELNQNGKIVYLQMVGDNGMVALGSIASKSLVVNAAGFVSVNRGYVNPTEALDVGGNIKASGNISANSITINGVTISSNGTSITVNGNVLATGDITGGM